MRGKRFAIPILMVGCVLLSACATSSRTALYGDGDVYFKLQRYVTAADIYRRQAELGDLQAARKLAWMYEQGKLGGKDFRQAAYWYQQLADQGDAEALYHIAVIYEYGLGNVEADPARAIELYTRAANANHVYSQYRLGALYTQGLAVPPDYVTAYMWLLLAERHARGCAARDALCDVALHDGFGYRWRLRQLLTTDQLRTAQQRVSHWAPQRG
ncbi:MAG: sel1 repeat family protein [Gammaproteobacteria bacterium]|nr:sel1 repeat family protein [Gammaproteobacteria bacterium]